MKGALRTIGLLVILVLLLAAPVGAQPSGTMSWGIHVTMPSRWLDPLETVKFSFERYRGAQARLFKAPVQEVQVDPGRVRFQLREPWPDFMTFYGTSASGAVWIVPRKHVEKLGGPRVEEPGLALVPAFPYSAPLEDVRLKQ